MKNKILIVTTTPYMIRQFLMNDIKILQELGYKIEIATNFQSFDVIDNKSLMEFNKLLLSMDIEIHQIDFPRSVFSIYELCKAYKQFINLISLNNYKMMHTHTPIASAISRFAVKKANDLKVIYTAHGFHFFKGAPFKNWLIFYPIEKWLSKFTDLIITINSEDFLRAKRKFLMKRIEYIPGVGIDTKKFSSFEFCRDKYREELGFHKDSFIIVSVGELNKNKNHKVIIKAIYKLHDKNIHYLIVGDGKLHSYLLNLIRRKKLENQIHLLGFRTDIAEILNSCDLFAFPSKREGLGLAAIEAMASGLPIISSNVHGINDFSVNNVTGFKTSPNDVNGFSNFIRKMVALGDKRKIIGHENKQRSEKYDISQISLKMKKIYMEVLNEEY